MCWCLPVWIELKSYLVVTLLNLWRIRSWCRSIIRPSDNAVMIIIICLWSNIQCSSVDLLEILAIHVQHRFAQANGGSINTTRIHAFHAACSPRNSAIFILWLFSLPEVNLYNHILNQSQHLIWNVMKKHDKHSFEYEL